MNESKFDKKIEEMIDRVIEGRKEVLQRLRTEAKGDKNREFGLKCPECGYTVTSKKGESLPADGSLCPKCLKDNKKVKMKKS